MEKATKQIRQLMSYLHKIFAPTHAVKQLFSWIFMVIKQQSGIMNLTSGN
jgi:hypothetical protein